MTTIGEANGKSSTFTINSYPDRLCGPPVLWAAQKNERVARNLNFLKEKALLRQEALQYKKQMPWPGVSCVRLRNPNLGSVEL